MAAGAARDLRHFGDRQAAVAAAVEFLQAGEGDVGDVHVEAHADGVGGDEIIDLAALEHRDLGVAGRGRKRAHDDRGAALEAAQHLGERVDLLGREGDDRAARRQARELDRAGIAQGREARAADDLGVGEQLADDRAERVGAKDERFLAAARAKHAVGEDVAALGVGAELRLVDRGEGELLVDRHRFGGGQEIARGRRRDPLLAGQQRDLFLALERDDAVIDLARQQTQREADDPRASGRTCARSRGGSCPCWWARESPGPERRNRGPWSIRCGSLAAENKGKGRRIQGILTLLGDERSNGWDRSWRSVGNGACSGSRRCCAAASPGQACPGRARPLSDDQRQWQALGVQPLAAGGRTGIRMAPAAVAEPVAFVAERETPFAVPKPSVAEADKPSGPMRITGRAGDGLYWALRSAGATPDAAAQYLAALAGEIDVGADIMPGDRFDLILAGGGAPRILYAGLDRGYGDDLQLVRWGEGWVDAAREEAPEPVETGMILPAAGRITSYFGTRIHPILRFARFHAGVDIGAGWGAPIVAAGDGQVVGAGWAGGYGRQVRIAHGGGTLSTYSHMSDYAVSAGRLRPPRPGHRLCRLVGLFDRAAPPFRGSPRGRRGQSAGRHPGQRAHGRPRASEEGEGAAGDADEGGRQARLISTRS